MGACLSGNGTAAAAPAASQAARAPSPNTFCSIHPYFTISDEDAARPIMDEFVDRTKREAGCVWYGWDKVGKQLFCNEAYVDAAAVLEHLDNVGECIQKLLAGPATLDSIEFHGPAAELEKLKETAEKLEAKCYAVDSGVSFMAAEGKAAEMPQTLCTIHPYFTIEDEKAARPIMDEFVEKTRSEPGCVYYGWTKVGNQLFCREGYANAEAVLAHLKNVGPCIDKILDGPAKLDRIEFHAPEAEMADLKKTADGLGAMTFTKDSGFQKYATV